jgi:unsaturated rhamnogalacturonyl hydrolase
MNTGEVRPVLERLAKRAGAELLVKEPHWGDAILCDALVQASANLDSEPALKAAIDWFEPRLSRGPGLTAWFWFWAAEALAAVDLHLMTGRADFLNYAREVVAAFETTTTRTADGAVVPHPPALEVWVDVAYFTAPAMAAVGRLLKDDGLLERALDQLIVHHRNLVDLDTGLCWHVAYVDKGTHSQCLWARGNSWFAIAAVQVIGSLGSRVGEGRFQTKVASLGAALARQLNAIVGLQDVSGLWHTVIDRKDSYLESSAAAGFALALGRALAHRIEGMNRESAVAAYERAIAAICGKVNERGDFTGVSQQTPPGDFAFYNSIEVGSAPFGTGICMMALSEKIRRSR